MFVSYKRELNTTRIEFMCIRVLLKQQLLIRESPFIDYRISRATFRDLEKEERCNIESKPKNYRICINISDIVISIYGANRNQRVREASLSLFLCILCFASAVASMIHTYDTIMECLNNITRRGGADSWNIFEK